MKANKEYVEEKTGRRPIARVKKSDVVWALHSELYLKREIPKKEPELGRGPKREPWQSLPPGEHS